MIDPVSFLQTAHTDAFLVSNFYNILYTTGFETLSPSEREAYVLVTKEDCISLPIPDTGGAK